MARKQRKIESIHINFDNGDVIPIRPKESDMAQIVQYAGIDRSTKIGSMLPSIKHNGNNVTIMVYGSKHIVHHILNGY